MKQDLNTFDHQAYQVLLNHVASCKDCQQHPFITCETGRELVSQCGDGWEIIYRMSRAESLLLAVLELEGRRWARDPHGTGARLGKVIAAVLMEHPDE